MTPTEVIIKDPTTSPEAKTHKLLELIYNVMSANSNEKSNVFSFTKDIEDFHKKFNQDYEGPVRALPADLQNFRTNFLSEELAEYKEAVLRQDLALQLDALFDLVYVAIGTADLMGIDFEVLWKEGHASNMSKELVEQGKGKCGFGVHKGKSYFKPNFEQFVK